jgi:hypothetical protein
MILRHIKSLYTICIVICWPVTWFEYLRRRFRVSLGSDIMTSGATGVFNGMAPLAGFELRSVAHH